MKEIFFIDLSEKIHLDRSLTVATNCRLHIFLSAKEAGINYVLSWLKEHINIDIASISYV